MKLASYIAIAASLLAHFFGLGSTARAEEDVIKGMLKQNRMDELIPICRQYEVLAGAPVTSLAGCAWAYYRNDQMEAGETIRAKLKGPTNSDYQLLTAYAHLKNKQFEQAKEILVQMEREYKGTAVGIDAQELYGELYEAMGQLDTAAFIYKQVVGDDATRGRAQWGLARYHVSRGENAKAIAYLIQTANSWPRHLASRYNLGVLYLAQDNLREAGRWLAESYKIDRADAGVLEHLGLLFEKKGQLSDAIKYWQRAVDVSDKSTIAKDKLRQYYDKLVDRAIEEKQYNRALVYLENAEKGGKTTKENLLRRGIIYRNQGKYEKAAGDLLAYVAAHPNDSNALRELGVCYLNMSLFAEAEQRFQQAVEIDPKDGMVYAWYGWLLEKKGKICEARKAWTAATKLIQDPAELRKATRRLATVEKRTKGVCNEP